MAVLRPAAFAFLGLLTACGLGPFAGEGGGGSNLPNAGVGPYGKLAVDLDTPIDEPIVLADFGADLLEPALLAREDGGFRIFVERRTEVGASEIWLAEIPALTENPDRPLEPVFVSSQAWEGGEVRAPSVARSSGDDLVMAYEAGDPSAIGLAISSDGGSSFSSESEPMIPDARSPSIAIAGETTYLFFERLDQPGIFVAVRRAGGPFETRALPVLRAGLGAEDFDRVAVERPAVLVRETASGRERFDLFYQGRNGVVNDGDPEIAIGYAGGFGLDDFVRAAPAGVAVLDPAAPSEEAPSVVIEPTRGVMLYVDRRSARTRIGGATSP